MTVNGRVYTGTANVPLDVPDQDAATLTANGWVPLPPAAAVIDYLAGVNSVTYDPTTGTLSSGVAGIYYSRAIASNGNRLPCYYQSDTRSVLNQARKRRVSSAASFSSVVLTYAGFYVYSGAESALTAPFTLRVGILYKGTYYPVTFGGSRDWTFPVGKTYKASDPVANLMLNAGDTFIEITRRVSNAANDNVLVTTAWVAAFGEWSYAGTDPSVDYTLGGAPGGLLPATGYFTINSGGTITQLTTTRAGSGYTGTYLPVYAFDPDTGLHAGTLIANIGVSAGANTTGVTSGGALVNTTGWGPNTRPVYGDASLDVQKRAYHACLVTGAPSRATSSLLVLGDSNDAGYSASDSLGDDLRNYGIYERAIGSRIGVAHLSQAGIASSSLVIESALPISHAIYDPLAAYGNLKVLWQACGNDIGGGSSAGAVLESIKAGAELWRGRGAQVSFATPVPRTTSTDQWATTANQTPAAGFAAGKAGAIDDVTYAIRYQTAGCHSDFGVFEARTASESPATPNVWRVDGGAVTTDGSHPSAARGMRIVAASCIVPPLI